MGNAANSAEGWAKSDTSETLFAVPGYLHSTVAAVKSVKVLDILQPLHHADAMQAKQWTFLRSFEHANSWLQVAPATYELKTTPCEKRHVDHESCEYV